MKNIKITGVDKCKNLLLNHIVFFLFIVCIIFSLFLGNIDEDFNYNNTYGRVAVGIGISILAIIFIILKITKKFKNEHKIYFIFTLIFFVYLGYSLNTGCRTRQYDIGGTNWQIGGHLSYIQYILIYGHLPNFNPTKIWSFANSPLFYIISAIFTKFQNLLGRTEYQAFENLQFLSIFYMMTLNIYSYKILKELKVEKLRNYIIMFIGLSTGIIYLSGGINNDVLGALLCVTSIYYTIKWYKTSKLTDLIKDALSIGMAVMTKLNTGIIAIPIAIVFLYKLIKEKENLKKYMCYYSIFAVIALPLGLWFPIRNLVKYNIPLVYIQEVKEKEEHEAYTGNHSVFERLFKADKDHLKTINISFSRGTADYNIFLTTLKSFMVGKNINYKNTKILKISLYILFVINVIFIILFIISFFTYKKTKEDIFMYLIFLIEMFFYIRFNFDYQYTFTAHFRLIAPIILIVGYSIGRMCDNNKIALKISKPLILAQSFFTIVLTLFIK